LALTAWSCPNYDLPLYLSHSLYISSVCLQFVLVAAGDGEKMLKRQKREWIIAPRKLNENYDYTHQAYIAKIRSDKEYDSRVIYTLMGKGADQNPFGRFSVNPDTGLVKVHSILDREEISNYTLLGVAKYSNGAKAEKDIELAIVVLDENDCSPVFQVNQMGSVNESSPAGTIVMRVTATDADEGINSVISYSIVDASSSMFIINSRTGEVMVRQNTLDRETKDTYTLTVRGTDLNGMAGGRSSTGDVVIKLLDINDNIPTLEKEMYVGHVEENTVNVEVMRVRAIDLDMMYTDNWLSVFSFASGNEAGYFSITTDSKTNEGVIMIQKSLDYEELKVVNLALSVSNKAEYSFRHEVTHKTYPIKINVVNQKEGPRFHPNVKVVTLSEDSSTISINKVITNYAAIDSDTTKIATNVWYAKLEDVGGWLTIDEHTADIKLNKLPDRESKYLKNGTYYAKIICITKDTPIKTATGTIAIQVEDYNDHCPELTVTSQTMCVNDNMVYVTAVDKDEFPNSAPFEFRVISESKQKWTIEPFNKTTVILRDQAHLWPGYYKVTLEVTDQQGKSCAAAQVLDVLVCTCREDTESCVARETSTAKFGASGVLLLLLGLLLLLLLPLLLLFCLCGGAGAIGSFKAIPFDAKEQLIAYHTEGLGEAKVPDINPNKIPQVNMFSHKASHGAQQSMEADALQAFAYEGQGSPAGSVGSFSMLDNDDDLEFLNDLGPKFKTLAEICQGSSLTSVDVRPSTSSVNTHNVQNTLNAQNTLNTHNTSSVVSGSSSMVQGNLVQGGTQGIATLPRMQYQDNMVMAGQTMLVQQPTMYYTAAPMYVVEQRPQMVLVTGGAQPAVGQVGLGQGLMQVGGSQQGVVLVETQMAAGTQPHYVANGTGLAVSQGAEQTVITTTTEHVTKAQGVSHGGSAGGSMSRQQVVMLDNGSASAGASGSRGSVQTVLLEGQGLAGPGLEVRDQGLAGFSVRYQQGSSAGSYKSSAVKTTPIAVGSQNVVTQHKKIVVTERNVETSSQA
uniref:Desmoglein 2 n=1 Tax=Gadus morhua TaxID=8049 RepID=A0A8C5F7T6_GADMO